MKIKELNVTGFKSFVDKTTVAFSEGISAVVGPNGCGKSNIVDAIRWVMGEQSVKLLRGKSMEDVIFSGTEKRHPLNMAEVSLTLINNNGTTPEQYREFSEIMVTRRLFRSGESAYFINKQHCRLKDIHNLFMGSGVGSRTYAVIEQARITTLIDAGPDERRFFIEEAAGTTRYKSRKNEALRKIERTKQNLVRINDVITEVKRQMNSLKRQAGKARRYKEYKKEIERLEVGQATHHFKAICKKMQETEALLRSLHDTDLEHGSQLAKLDAAIEEIIQEQTAKGQEISEHKNKQYLLQRTIDKIEGDLEHGAKDLKRLIAEAEQLNSEIKEIENKDHEISLECSDLDKRLISLKQNMKKIEQTTTEKEPEERALKNRLYELNQTIEKKKAELMSLATRKAAYQNTLQNASQNKANLARRLEHLKKEKGLTEKEHVKLEKEQTRTNAQLDEIRQYLTETNKSLESMDKQLEVKRQSLAGQVRQVQIMEAEKQKTRSRHTALKKLDENYEWYKGGVRAIMKKSSSQDPKQTGIHGLVVDVIEAEPSYEDAVEAALGETLQYVIVTDQQGGMDAIDFLRTQSAGRGGFIPINGHRSITDLNSAPDVQKKALDIQRPLIEHIKVKKGYEKLIQSLIGHVEIAEDLKLALQQWNKNGFQRTVVTQNGDHICSRGFMVGGSPDKATSGILAKKREIRELDQKFLQLETSTAKAKAEQERLQAEAIELETNIQKTRQLQRQKSQEEMVIEKELYRLGEEIRHAKHRLKILNLETQQLKGEETDLDQEFSKYEDTISKLSQEIKTTDLAIANVSTEIKTTSENLELYNQKLMGLRLELTKLKAQHDNEQNTLQRLKSFQDERLVKLDQLTTKLKQKAQDKIAVEQSLASNRNKIGLMHAELKTMEEVSVDIETEYNAIKSILAENDRAISDVRNAKEQTLHKIQQLELKQAERGMRSEHLVNRIQENYHLNIKSPDHEIDTGELSLEEIEEVLESYREKISRIGDVNLAAIQDYQEFEERYGFLTEQRDDLVESIDALRRVIRKINRISLKQFIKAFKAVNEKLQEVFPSLFEGGTARLALTDPKRPLESGVSYFVHPPGKKLTRMSLLSGGEKALSAIALVFSLFLFKPSAFCIFDEIDAPLDDINTHRFNRLLKQIGTNSQVVVVTHNKQTMEVADSLFGVTMEDKGISKLISFDLAGNREQNNG